jgi:hypothetical protein
VGEDVEIGRRGRRQTRRGLKMGSSAIRALPTTFASCSYTDSPSRFVFCRKATASWYASSVAVIARNRTRRSRALREVRVKERDLPRPSIFDWAGNKAQGPDEFGKYDKHSGKQC